MILVEITPDNRDRLLEIIPKKYAIIRAMVRYVDFIKTECLIERLYIEVAE